MKYDKETKKWFSNHVGQQTTVCKCEKCGMFYKPSLGHKCSKLTFRKENNANEHIETLIMNEVRKSLENLQGQGVGYIDFEQTGVIHYLVDGRDIRISVADVTGD